MEKQDLRIYDTNNICYGLFESDIVHSTISYLYFSKREIDVSFFYGRELFDIFGNKIVSEDEFELVMKYIYPLIEEGKLKARVAKKIECEIMPDGVPRYTTVLWGEYGKGQGKEFVQDAERYYKKCENSEHQRNFREWSILFTLPENKWPY